MSGFRVLYSCRVPYSTLSCARRYCIDLRTGEGVKTTHTSVLSYTFTRTVKGKQRVHEAKVCVSLSLGHSRSLCVWVRV